MRRMSEAKWTIPRSRVIRVKPDMSVTRMATWPAKWRVSASEEMTTSPASAVGSCEMWVRVEYAGGVGEGGVYVYAEAKGSIRVSAARTVGEMWRGVGSVADWGWDGVEWGWLEVEEMAW